MNRCNGCGVEIAWRVNDQTGRRAPIEHEVTDRGNVVVLDDGSYHVITKTCMEALDGTVPLIVDPALEKELTLVEGRPRKVSHFAKCTEADIFTRRDPVNRQTRRRT